MTRLLLVRHGESEWNAAGRWQGWANPPLSDVGKLQAADAAERLRSAGITTIVASDLQRTTRTAEIIGGILGVGPVHPEPGLREFDVGEWSGLTRPEIEQRWPGQLDQWRVGELERTPGGELREHFADRILDAVQRVAHQFAREIVLVVTHGGVVGTLQRVLGDTDNRERVANLCGRWIEVADGRPVDRDALVLGPFERLVDPDEFTLSPSR